MDTTVTGKLDELGQRVQWACDEIDTLRADKADLLAALKDLHGDGEIFPNAECRFCGRDYAGDPEGTLRHCDEDCPGEIARAAIRKPEGGAL